MIRIIKILLMMMFIISNLYGQQVEMVKKKGKISYKSSQNIYVQFESTDGIEKGDTLFYEVSKGIMPAVRVEFISSTSCAGIILSDKKLNVGDVLITFAASSNGEKSIEPSDNAASVYVSNNYSSHGISKKTEQDINRFDLRGKFSVSSYSNISNIEGDRSFQRWRYRFILGSDNIYNSGFSFDTYTVFSYRANDWNRVSNNLGEAFRFYNFNIKYRYNKSGQFILGRSINPKISNIGAIDGLQWEHNFRALSVGAVVGSRPNFSDYGYNSKLFQYGLYVSRVDTMGYGTMVNTLSYFEQTNNYKTDRRFLYYQFVNSSIKRVRLFASSELDLFKIENGEKKNSLTLTSLYISATVKAARWLSISSSYDARKNVIYYETFKSTVDSLIDAETRQGFRLRTNFRPVNYIFASIYFGYRNKKGDLKPSKNYGASISYSRLLFIPGSISLSYNGLKTSYVDGNIFGGRYFTNLISNFMDLGINFRKVIYNFTFGGNLDQNIASADISIYPFSNIIFSISYEGTFEERNSFSRLFINFSTKF